MKNNNTGRGGTSGGNNHNAEAGGSSRRNHRNEFDFDFIDDDFTLKIEELLRNTVNIGKPIIEQVSAQINP